MDIKEFVAETLKQVSEAVEENPTTYNPKGMERDSLQSINMFANKGNVVTFVDFDIAVTEITSQNGGAKLSVVGVGSLGGDLKESAQTVSKLKFRVPISLNPNKGTKA